MSEESRRLRLVNASPVPLEENYPSATDIDAHDSAQIRKSPTSVDPLLTAEEVAQRLRVSKDWVWDHSSRKSPRLPVIRMGEDRGTPVSTVEDLRRAHRADGPCPDSS